MIDQIPFLYVITITRRATQKPYICVFCHHIGGWVSSLS